MLNTPAAFQTILDDPENEKQIMLTWTFSDLNGNVVLLCDDCRGMFLECSQNNTW